MRVPAGLFAVALLGAVAHAQPYGTDVNCSTTGQIVYRISPAGTFTTVISGTGSIVNMVAMDNDNQNLAIINTTGPSLRIVDPTVGMIVRTVWTGAPLTGANYFNPIHTGDFAICSGTGVFVVKHDGSAITTLLSGAPLSSVQSLVQDLATGHIAAGDITASCIFDIDLNGTLVNTWVPGQVGPFAMTQDPRSGDLILGQGANAARGVYRFSHVTSTVTTIAAQPVVGNSNAICFDRAPGNGDIVVGTSPVRRIDMTGAVLATYSGVPLTNSGMCFDKERNVVSIRAASPNVWRFSLNFPGEAGNGYVMALSATGFTPGIPVDTRVISLVPDFITVLSISGGLFPLLQGNVGVLDANDRGSASLDLSSIGTGPLTGFRIWAVAVTLNGAAPSGIQTIGKPIILVLD
jgi:hypothetical protein